MISIVYRRDKCTVTAEGHAYSGESGHDLVCAAVSALVLTLSANVASLVTQESAEKPVVSVQEGSAYISCKPVETMRAVVTMVFDTVCTGFELLQTLYPKNIRFTVQDGKT